MPSGQMFTVSCKYRELHWWGVRSVVGQCMAFDSIQGDHLPGAQSSRAISKIGSREEAPSSFPWA